MTSDGDDKEPYRSLTEKSLDFLFHPHQCISLAVSQADLVKLWQYLLTF